MKLSKSFLKQIIKEELSNMHEQEGNTVAKNVEFECPLDVLLRNTTAPSRGNIYHDAESGAMSKIEITQLPNDVIEFAGISLPITLDASEIKDPDVLRQLSNAIAKSSR